MTWTHLVCNVFVARRGFVRTACLGIGLIASIADRALAHELTPSANIYIGKNFTVEDGLLSNRVNAIVQTRDGFLWVGTEEGLLRFVRRLSQSTYRDRRRLRQKHDRSEVPAIETQEPLFGANP